MKICSVPWNISGIANARAVKTAATVTSMLFIFEVFSGVLFVVLVLVSG